MKKYIVMLFGLILVSGTAIAGGSIFDGMSKEELSNYEIQVLDKRTGKVIGKMSRAEYKVVRIDSSESERMKNFDLGYSYGRSFGQYEGANRAHYSVIVTGGIGNDGLEVNHSGNYEVKEKRKAVGQVTGCSTKHKVGICGTASTNDFFGLGLKFDFK